MIGFSPRESNFLTTVRRCGGYFIRRQLSPGRGGDVQVLIKKLGDQALVRRAAQWGQTQVLQLVGGRRHREAAHIVQCLMRLDYVLLCQSVGVEPDLDGTYIDAGPGTRPAFRTWLCGRLVGKESVYVTAGDNVDGVAKAKRVFVAMTGDNSPLPSFFLLQRAADVGGFAGWPQSTLNRYRKLAKMYGNANYRRQYEAWKALPDTLARPRFSIVTLPHNYSFGGHVSVAAETAETTAETVVEPSLDCGAAR